MATRRSLSIATILALLGLMLGMQAAVTADTQVILRFESMVGVPTALTGTQAPIRGVNGGGIAWTLRSAEGRLLQGGDLRIKVRGLVLAAGTSIGSNPAASFRGLVSCLGSDGTITNVMTDPFPATTGPASAGGGNAVIHAVLTLPHPCIAPIIFVTSATGSWFATTGG